MVMNPRTARSTYRPARACRAVFLALLLGAWVSAGEREGDKIVIDEGFEGEIPKLHTYKATYAADSARAHSGRRCLRVTPKNGGSGGAYFKLGGRIELDRDYEFSGWVYAGADGGASLYISAKGEKQRYTKSRDGGGKAGQWVRLNGVVRARDWKTTDSDIMLALVTRGESWFDDVVLRATTLPDPPIETWPKLKALLCAEAGKRAVKLSRGSRLVLTADRGVLAQDVGRLDVKTVAEETVAIPADGFLVFAIDAVEPMYARGTLSLASDQDLRPGLRAYVLCDDTLIGTPMVAALEWESVGNRMTGPAPNVAGAMPPRGVQLAQWRLDKGRHYLAVAGPHFRPGGVFGHLEIRSLNRKPEAPLYQFALFADTHLGAGRSTWMNVKMNGPAVAEFASTLGLLRSQRIAFALLAGDMTDSATREQFETLAGVLKASGLPAYGCVGNHDAYRSSSRPDMLDLMPWAFPGGKTDYVLDKQPLRFVVVDASYWRTKDGKFVDFYERANTRGIGMKPEQVEWLRGALAEDTSTPTVVMWHYPFYNGGGLSSCGYKLRAQTANRSVLNLLEKTPNVIATVNGHTHWDAVDNYKGITCVQNGAFAEWPNSYRVFRVFADRMEWEVRQVNNRGFVRESFVVKKALSWMISTRDGDLAGEVKLTPRRETGGP